MQTEEKLLILSGIVEANTGLNRSKGTLFIVYDRQILSVKGISCNHPTDIQKVIGRLFDTDPVFGKTVLIVSGIPFCRSQTR